MKCPVCEDVKMREAEKEGVMIDICPSCKGVWLDRGELDKLLQGAREIREPFNQWYEGYEKSRKPEYYDHHEHRTHYKKKKTFWAFSTYSIE